MNRDEIQSGNGVIIWEVQLSDVLNIGFVNEHMRFELIINLLKLDAKLCAISFFWRSFKYLSTDSQVAWVGNEDSIDFFNVIKSQ